MENKKLLSVIIPAYNEEKEIGECFNSLFSQSYKNIEIIIIDDGSTDKTCEIIKEFQERNKKIKILKQNHKGPGEARNLGAKNARGEILIFIDADMTFDKDYLKNLINPILTNKETIGTTHESEIVKNTNNLWSRCWGKVKVSKENAKEVTIFRAIRKDKFIEFGGFDSKYGYADDQTFWFKHKVKPTVAENTLCYHKNPETLKSVYKQSRWIGASIENFLFKIPLLKYIIPFLFILLSPILIPLLSIKKSYKNRDLKILIPWMFIFMIFRYFGTINGIINRIYFEKNVR